MAVNPATAAACTNLCTDDAAYAKNSSYSCGGDGVATIYRSTTYRTQRSVLALDCQPIGQRLFTLWHSASLYCRHVTSGYRLAAFTTATLH